MYGAKLEAKSRARRMAWLQAESGQCPAQSCRDAECVHIAGEVRSGVDELFSVENSRFSLRNLVGELGTYFLGKTTHGIGLAEEPTSKTVGSGTTTQRGVTALLCNTIPRAMNADAHPLEHACRTELRTLEYANEICG